jgi:hypothetical protein
MEYARAFKRGLVLGLIWRRNIPVIGNTKKLKGM